MFNHKEERTHSCSLEYHLNQVRSEIKIKKVEVKVNKPIGFIPQE